MNKPVIICVDDEISILKSLKIELKEAIGDTCLIELAQGGEDALELVEKFLADHYEIPLIIADHLMPDIKGDEFLRRVHLYSPKTLKVLLTGQANLEDIANAIKYANLYRYIAKPWQAEDLQLTVKEAINSYFQEKRLAEQTTQLQQMNQALVESEHKYRSIFENALEGIFQSTSDGHFLGVNPALAQLYGYDSPDELVVAITDIQYQVYVDANRRTEFIASMEQHNAVSGFESQVYRKDGSIIWISETARAVRDATGELLCYQGFIIDITERKQAEILLADYNRILESQVAERTEALQQQKELLQTIVDHIPVMITLYDQNGQIHFVNRELECILGWSSSELEHINLLTECNPDPEQCQQVLNHMLAATGKWLDIKIKTKDDRNVDTSWANIRLSSGMSIGIGQDITERLEAALRERKQAEEASILEERNRMAREIHDTLAQAFTSIIVHLNAASQRIMSDPNAVEVHLNTGRSLARSGLAEARRSVEALRPQLLEDGDLFSALNRIALQLFSHTHTCILCEIIGEAYALPPDVETNLLRIGQEALTNALKYSKASEIRVELVYDRAHCILRVKDDGQGFEVRSVSLGSGFGLIGMTERAERIGAQLTIQSEPGQGAEVVVSVNRE